jgi:hypothetical protein
MYHELIVYLLRVELCETVCHDRYATMHAAGRLGLAFDAHNWSVFYKHDSVLIHNVHGYVHLHHIEQWLAEFIVDPTN